MKKNIPLALSTALIFILACSFSSGPVTQPVVEAATYTPLPTYTPEPTYTAAALPTETPVPTETPPPTAIPDTVKGSKPIQANDSYNGTTQNASEIFYFNGREGQLVTIVVTGLNHYQTFSIRNDKNKGLLGNNIETQTTSAIRSYKLPYTGLYYILVDRTDSPQYGKYCQDRWNGSSQSPVWCYVGGPYALLLTIEQ